jgi:hypothetical protein
MTEASPNDYLRRRGWFSCAPNRSEWQADCGDTIFLAALFCLIATPRFCLYRAV